MINLRRILTVIDVETSAESQYAEALAMAGRYQAELHLLHVVAPQVIPRFGSEKRLQQAREKLSSLQISNEQVSVIRDIRRGTLIDCVSGYVRDHAINLVVIAPGGVAASGKKEYRGIVNRLLDVLPIPVVVEPFENRSESNQIHRASAVLQTLLEDPVAGEREETLKRLHQAIETELELPAEQAERLVTQLEMRGILIWNEAESDGDSVEEADGDPSTDRGHWSLDPAPVEEAHPVNENSGDAEETTTAISLLRRAIEAEATDIHIDPLSRDEHVVHFRVDGKMQQFCTMHHNIATQAMKQLKLMANVSLSDPFRPAESRLDLPDSISTHEVRITTAPVAQGEAIALRLIDYEQSRRPLSELGLSQNSFASVYRMLHRRSGVVLISGPTGAGKTTTAYSILNVLFSEKQNIISIEDPVELIVPFMRQIDVDQRHGFTMAAGLSTILRMDPDVVFVGEIRDQEGAKVAMHAASCGKRAFSTIHRRDVSSTLSAMLDFEIDSATLASNLSGVITQRLVRRLCTHCCQVSPVTRQEQALFESHNLVVPTTIARPRSCQHCRGTGYKGRIGVFEAVVIDDELSDAIQKRKQESEIRTIIRAGGAGLVRDALMKVRDKITSIQEVQDMSWMTETMPIESPSEADDDSYQRGAPFLHLPSR
ncbi:Putative type II secretion system protein E [Stieleria maiorica]|uniref:Type II secretion system protein E n=1 Tax=Stieleria maiorica TaxID=2795974 RepID=A0A5B9MD82_9BACT|nr:ATPase, T2SS/T4P/T4SS family [Stieleria maiorica]QEF97207.1 Putative type II secretion system protein E [Stieleria maiorica]